MNSLLVWLDLGRLIVSEADLFFIKYLKRINSGNANRTGMGSS